MKSNLQHGRKYLQTTHIYVYVYICIYCSCFWCHIQEVIAKNTVRGLYSYVFFSEFVVEKAMAPHSSALAWKIPWTEEPGGLQSMGSLGVGHDWATSLSFFTFTHWRRKWQPTPVFLPGESQGQVAWWAAVHGVAQSRTRLKLLSSSSRSLWFQVLYLSL